MDDLYWKDMLAQKFKVYHIEQKVYIESSQKANGPEMFAKFICDAIQPGDVPDALKRLYREAVYGTNEKVKSQICNRMYLICRHVR